MTKTRRNDVVVTLFVVILSIRGLESRDLRPSEHGLPFQNNPATSPEMEMFFGDQFSPPSKRPPAKVTPGSSTSDSSSWWRATSAKDEVKEKKGLLVATAVCGGTGVVLLLATAVLLAVHFRRQRLGSGGADNNHQTSVPAASLALPSPPVKSLEM